MKIQDQQDCEGSIRRINQLFECGIFDAKNSSHVLYNSAYIELMICLRDLMHKTEQYAARVDFTDDILVNKYVKDVHDAVTTHRDACCHINSFKHRFDDQGNRGAFNICYGKGNLMKINDVELRSDYEDDVAIFFGTNHLYMQRHIIRAFDEFCERLVPILQASIVAPDGCNE